MGRAGRRIEAEADATYYGSPGAADLVIGGSERTGNVDQEGTGTGDFH